MRGADRAVRGQPHVHGIIPARAGSSKASAPPGNAIGDHPRACGEQPSCAPKSTMRMGSSPRVRGAVFESEDDCDGGGIIPARAGSRSMTSMPWMMKGDHPRACGEQRGKEEGHRIQRGSSPRVRGAAWYALLCVPWPGIIPARAGSSARCASTERLSQDHPRACGEQLTHSVTLTMEQGSSPRVRGAVSELVQLETKGGIIPARAGSRHRCLRARGARRIIPARAGSSSVATFSSARPRDHPRACGEQGGAAPHATRRRGIIPARAGSSAYTCRSRRRARDHPRACGEQSDSHGSIQTVYGIIPARAGSSLSQ